MTKDELIKGALTQLGVVPRPAAPRPCATVSPTVACHSPRFGHRSGRLLMVPRDGWVLVRGEHTPDLLVWVREDLLYAEA